MLAAIKGTLSREIVNVKIIVTNLLNFCVFKAYVAKSRLSPLPVVLTEEETVIVLRLLIDDLIADEP